MPCIFVVGECQALVNAKHRLTLALVNLALVDANQLGIANIHVCQPLYKIVCMHVPFKIGELSQTTWMHPRTKEMQDLKLWGFGVYSRFRRRFIQRMASAIINGGISIC